MIHHKEHPHNDLSKEEIEAEIKKLIEKIQVDYENIYDNLSPIVQSNWIAVLKEARFSDNRESVFNHLHDLIRQIESEIKS